MANESPIGRLKAALIKALTDAVENGVKVLDKETGELETVTCPANVLAVAAKVVKDFHEEVGVNPSMTELADITKRYMLRKGEAAAH